jgi:predicted porin
MRRSAWVAAVACVSLFLVTAAQAGPVDDWEVEAGMQAGYHDNFFYRGEGQDAPSENLYSLYSMGELRVDPGPGKLSLSYRATAIATTQIEGSDYQDYSLGAGYKLGMTKLKAEYGYTPNRVFAEDGDGVFFDQQRRALEVRQGIISGLWVGGEYVYKRQDFDPVKADRDARVRGLSGTLRIPLGNRVGIRGTVFRETKEATGPEYDWEGRGYAVGLEVNPTRRLNLFLRYKNRDRDYEDAPPTDSNFEREDSTQDYLLNVRWQAGRHWGISVEDFYRDGESTRPDRNYDGNRVTGSFFMVFGGPSEGE